MSEQASEFGVIGLTSAGQELAVRLANRGFRVSIWDASFASIEQFTRDHMASRGGLVGFEDLADFFDSLALPPRVAMFLPKDSDAAERAAQLAGPGVQFIDAGGATVPQADAVLDSIEAQLIAQIG